MSDPRTHDRGDTPDGADGASGDPRLHAPATQRNRRPILEVLMRLLPARGTVLELASGTGEHAVWFAQQLRPLVWQPSDADPAMRASIDAHARAQGVASIRPAVALDVTDRPWPVERADGAVCINLIHIAPWSAAEGLFAGCGAILPTGAPLLLYGPFKRDGAHTADSNARFDESLRQSNPAWGVRDLADVDALARANGFEPLERVEMPANNLTVAYRRA